MIHIDRRRVPEPLFLRSKELQSIRKSAQRYFSVAESDRRQVRFDFGLQFGYVELGEALGALFHGKCAYCEQPTDYVHRKNFLDRFRPIRGALGLDGHVAVDHYWWLAFDWENMYGACSRCNRAKGSRFPVEAQRAATGARGDALLDEKSLLLDPCVDFPEKHLIFTRDGHVSGLTPQGQHTIEVLALNRIELVSLRSKEAQLFFKEMAASGSSRSASELVGHRRSFAALRRCLANEAAANANERQTLAKKSKNAKDKQAAYDAERRDFHISSSQEQVALERGRARYIERIKLRNIGMHSNLELKVVSESGGNAPWLMLLGENGAGKSTLLKAVAFLLAGPSEWQRLGAEAGALLPQRKGAGEIEITFTDGETVTLQIDAEAMRVHSSFTEPRYRVIGFGATRLLPNAARRPPHEPAHARLANLFDPFCPLPDATAWLSKLGELQFKRASATIKTLLNLRDASHLEVCDTGILLVERKIPQDIRELSDGYQTVIGVACAIMAGLVGPDQPVETAEGIVLIDELGNHLHPSWRMRIVRSLKRAFPRVQFIVTTHEPLCLRGLGEGEIAVMRRVGPRTTILLKDIPPIAGMLVDQILSSPHFGLDSTMDPDTADMLDEYYRLLAQSKHSKKEQDRLETLAHLVGRIRPLGDTPREQILMRAIDERLARASREHRAIDPGALPPDFMEALQEIMEKAR
ncbi:MAG: hypothetical protein EON58_00145 [Alphaproteobacteria bacterium]|nr:MAG: hypothetical protein EON58_00145 [Alphaproteobacteria bacterium]